jgi:hypothetical protein
MDEHDNPIDLHWLLTERFPGLSKVFARTDPEVVSPDNILFTSGPILGQIARIIGSYVIELAHDIAVSMDMSDEDYESLKEELSQVARFDIGDIKHYTEKFVENYMIDNNDLPDINIPALPNIYSEALAYDYSYEFPEISHDISNMLQERMWITDKDKMPGTVLGKSGKWTIGHNE